jgi:hypothetical protein
MHYDLNLEYKLATYRLDELIREATEDRLGRSISQDRKMRRGMLRAFSSLWR